MNLPEIRISLPDWTAQMVDWDRRYENDLEAMELAIALSRENIAQGGGPFGAVIIESGNRRLVSIGINMVVPLNNSLLHAETVAIMMAQAVRGSYTLGGSNSEYTLYSSCAPCAMCIGATLWSGVRRLVYGALREDAERIGFDEGPVFPESYSYLESRGIGIVPGMLRREACQVLERYAASGAVIYNPPRR